VPGWLRDPGDAASVVSEASAEEVEKALEHPGESGVSGGMRPKLQACLEAIHGGVGATHIVDGRVPHSLLLELFTDTGQGSMIVR
jgi:acetylglutamate kinase